MGYYTGLCCFLPCVPMRQGRSLALGWLAPTTCHFHPNLVRHIYGFHWWIVEIPWQIGLIAGGGPPLQLCSFHAISTSLHRSHNRNYFIWSDCYTLSSEINCGWSWCYRCFWEGTLLLKGYKIGFFLRLSPPIWWPSGSGQSDYWNVSMLHCWDTQKMWVQWLLWAEYCYNTSFHILLLTSLFKVVYGRDSPRLLAYTIGSSPVDALDNAL